MQLDIWNLFTETVTFLCTIILIKISPKKSVKSPTEISFVVKLFLSWHKKNKAPCATYFET